MSAYSIQIEDFLGGLTNLPKNKRAINQTEDMINVDIEESGVRKRNGIDSFNTNTHDINSFSYMWDTGALQGYCLIIEKDTVFMSVVTPKLTLYNQAGQEISLEYLPLDGTVAQLKEYLRYFILDRPSKIFKCSTIKDVTYIINTSKVVKMLPYFLITQYEYDKNIGVWFKESQQGGGYNYKIEENGTVFNHSSSDTKQIAQDFQVDIGVMSSNFGSFLYIDNSAQKTYIVSDSNGDNASILIDDTVNTIEDLPQKIREKHQRWFYWELNDGQPYFKIFRPRGDGQYYLSSVTRQEPQSGLWGVKLTFPNKEPDNVLVDEAFLIVQVLEGNSKENGGYFVAFKNGAWEEVPRPEQETTIDRYTMPLALSKHPTDPNKFTISHMLLNQMRCTDELPPFVGEKIQDIIWYGDRLGLITRDSITFSGIIKDDNISFFKTTARKDLTGDTFAYGISATKEPTIRKVFVTSYGIVLLTSIGVYVNRFNNNVVSRENNIIMKVSDFVVDFGFSFGNSIGFIASGDLWEIDPQNGTTLISKVFRRELDNTIAVATDPTNGYSFFLQEDHKEIIVYKHRYNLFLKWRFEDIDIYNIGCVMNQLVLVCADGIYAMPLNDIDTVVEDNGQSFISRYKIPTFYVPKGKSSLDVWSKVFFKRLECFFETGECELELIRDNLPTETRQELKIYQPIEITGTNQDTQIYLYDDTTEQFILSFIQISIYIENKGLR